MASAKERAQAFARELRDAIRAARAADARARTLSEEFTQILPELRAEAEAARNIVEYPPGRYECNSCHQPVLFTDTQRELPPCDNCGRSTGYSGPPPKVLDTIPAVPRKFPAGVYECTRCRARLALVEDSDTLSPCEFCGAAELRAP